MLCRHGYETTRAAAMAAFAKSGGGNDGALHVSSSCGSITADQHARRIRGMSASLRSRPNPGTAAKRRDVPIAT
jgi:hypothetical protein